MTDGNKRYLIRNRGLYRELTAGEMHMLCRGFSILQVLPSIIFSATGTGVDFLKGTLSKNSVQQALQRQLQFSFN